MSFTADAYGRKDALTAELGLRANITDNWKVAFSVFNLTRTKISEFGEDRLNTLMRLGTQYTFSEKVKLVAEPEKKIEFPKIPLITKLKILQLEAQKNQ